MYRIVFLPIIIFTFCYPQEHQLLNKSREDQLNFQKDKIANEHNSLKNNWISPWSIQSSINKNISTTNTHTSAKKISIGFSQDIYRSGGINFSIQYANEKYKQDLYELEDERSTLLYEIYNNLLRIKKIKMQIDQNRYSLKNQDIEIYKKKIQYESGQIDIVELNNALMGKNTKIKENIILKNSLTNSLKELSRYTDLKYDEIELINFNSINKDKFLSSNLSLKIQQAKESLSQKEYQKNKSDYLPSVSLKGEYGYSQSENNTLDTTNKGDHSSIGVYLSIPIDYFKSSKLNVSKKEHLIQKNRSIILKKELLVEYEQTINNIKLYEEHNKILNNNIELYDELLNIVLVKVKNGYVSKYDADILNNTKKIDMLELKINEISIQEQLALLFFKMKG
ncbi:MAG: TolC family protein [Campylobacterota bacterium]|nr:TolC family protein [Campylobacterota bacterium]